jgi:hypothetical protein
MSCYSYNGAIFRLQSANYGMRDGFVEEIF